MAVSGLPAPTRATEPAFGPRYPSLPLRFYEAPTEWWRGLRADVANMLAHTSVRLAFVYAVAFRVLDVLSTASGLGRGLPELNPVTRFVVGRRGIAGLATEQVAVLIVLLVTMARVRRSRALLGFCSATVLGIAPVAWNLLQ